LSFQSLAWLVHLEDGVAGGARVVDRRRRLFLKKNNEDQFFMGGIEWNKKTRIEWGGHIF
jgi:hypothetical protein